MHIPAFKKTKAYNIFALILLILLMPFFVLVYPIYLVYIKLKFDFLYRHILASIIFLFYFLFVLFLVILFNPKIININNVNLVLQTSDNKELLNPKVDKKINPNEATYFVTRVIDGDTIEISTGDKVRYIGINAPELTGKGNCFGASAKQKNVNLVLNKKVKLVKDISDKDKYGRLLRYVYVDNIFVNKYLVEEGYANASTYPPDVAHKTEFVAAQKLAQEKSRGLWGECFR